MPFAWGQIDGISNRLGLAKSGGPEAELWIGSHPNHPSTVITANGAAEPLSNVEPVPFMLKFLAVGEMLSLQAHPNAAFAKAGFERETAAGIDVRARDRSYRDPNAKPEMVVALDGEFRAFAGCAPIATTARHLQTLARLGAASDSPDRERLLTLAKVIGQVPPLERVERMIAHAAVVHRAFNTATPDGFATFAASTQERRHWEALRDAAERYPGDPGLGIALMLNYVELHAGEALWVPPGTPHAYISGTAIEIMGPSDNVLRVGFTQKHVDVDEFLRVLQCDHHAAGRITPEHDGPVARYRPPDVAKAPFELYRVRNDATVHLPRTGLALVTDGGFVISTAHGKLALDRGGSAVLPAGPTEMTGDGQLFIASGVVEAREKRVH